MLCFISYHMWKYHTTQGKFARIVSHKKLSGKIYSETTFGFPMVSQNSQNSNQQQYATESFYNTWCDLEIHSKYLFPFKKGHCWSENNGKKVAI